MQHKCYKCGTEFDGNFCPECGEKWLENKTCPKCGATLAGNAKFCNNCGFSFAPKPQPAPQPSQKADATPKPQPATGAPKPRPDQKSDADRQKTTVYTVCLYLPYALIALFSILFFLFYLAPVAVMPGGELLGETIPAESYGNIYQMVSGDIFPALAGGSIACIVFSALLLADTLLCLYVAVIRHDTHGAQPLEILGQSFYLALFIIGCVMMGIVGKEDGGIGMVSVGAVPILIVVFSLLEIVLSVAAECIRQSIARRSPEVEKAYEEKNALWQKEYEEKAALRQKNKEEQIAGREREEEERRKQYLETTPAPVPPKKIPRPQKPKKPARLISRSIVPEDKRGELIPEMVKHIKRKRTLASLLGLIFSFCTIILDFNVFFVVEMRLGIYWSGIFVETIRTIVLPGASILVFISSICFLIWSHKSRSDSWRPDKIYRIGKSNFLFAIIIIELIITIIFTFEAFEALSDFISSQIDLDVIVILAGGGISFLLFIPSLVLYLKTVKQRKAICIKLCGAESIKKSPLVEEYQKELSEYNTKLKNYQLKKKDYQGNRRAWTVYRYQKKRYDSGKTYQNITYTRAWLYFHRVALSAASVTLAAVITVTCVLATRDTRFNIDNLVKIGLGADQQAVTEVLGDPFEKQGDVWYYFSKNYMSIQEKMDKAMESDSIEDALEESAALEEKLQTLEYQAIIVRFSGNKVTSMMLDAAAVGSSKLLGVPHEKEAVEQSLSKTSFRLGDTADSAYYTVSYSDGSYCMAYLPAIQLTEEGEQTIKWTNVWGTYTATVTVRK